MHNDSNTDNGLSDGVSLNSFRPVRRLDTPNRPIAISTYVLNTLKEALLHPTVTSTLDMRTGKVIARDGKKLSN